MVNQEVRFSDGECAMPEPWEIGELAPTTLEGVGHASRRTVIGPTGKSVSQVLS